MIKLLTTTAKFTNTSRILVNRVKTNKINLNKASDVVKDFFENSTKHKEYSKNIFKRAWVWVKDFIDNLKEMVNVIRKQIKKNAEKLGKNFTKKDAKTIKKDILALVNETVKKIKTEIDKLTKKTVKKSSPKSKIAKVTQQEAPNATPSFAGKNIKKIKLSELKEIAKANGATDEMLNGAKTKAQVTEIIENLAKKA